MNPEEGVDTMLAAEPNQPSSPCIVAGFDNSPPGYDAVALARRLAAAIDARLIVAYIYTEVLSAIDIVPPPELVAQRRDEALGTVERASIAREGFDGSPESRAALSAAATLAYASGASLRALSAFEAPNPANPVYAVTGHGYTEIMGELREMRRAQLDQAVAGLPCRVDADGRIIDGEPAEVLAAESERLDLFVLRPPGHW